MNFMPSVFAAGIGGGPAAGNAVALLEDFLDGPEGGERQDTEECLRENRLHKKGGRQGCYAQDKEPPPAAGAEPIVEFDYNWVEKPDDEECADAEQQPGEMK